jgi:hypothetical protein
VEKQKVGARSLARNTLRVKGHAGAAGWGLEKMTSLNYSQGLAQIKQQVG